MVLRILNLWFRLRASYWFIPSLMAGLAIALSVGMAELDQKFGIEFARNLGWIYTGGPEGARAVLGAIAGSVIGVAGTTFSILIAVLSLTSGQFGPRLLQNFMRDSGNQFVLGAFTSTYLYCLLVLRTVRGAEGASYVPHFSVTLGVVFAIFCVGVLIYFVHHVAESIQVSNLIEDVGKDADEGVRRLLPAGVRKSEVEERLPFSEPASLRLETAGYLESIDRNHILKIAIENDLVIRIEVRAGDYILPGMTVLSVWPDGTASEGALLRTLACGRRRTSTQDAEFSFLQLAEIAVRALSPGINDPFTAMQCLDRITATMCLVASRPWPEQSVRDSKGRLRVMDKVYRPEDLVRAAYGHILDAAGSSPAVLDKLQECLSALIERQPEFTLLQALEALRSRMSSIYVK